MRYEFTQKQHQTELMNFTDDSHRRQKDLHKRHAFNQKQLPKNIKVHNVHLSIIVFSQYHIDFVLLLLLLLLFIFFLSFYRSNRSMLNVNIRTHTVNKHENIRSRKIDYATNTFNMIQVKHVMNSKRN
jgi:hypothetical protein